MAELQNFRSAFNGFHREDVVNYLSYLNSQHTSQLNQLRNQLDAAQKEVQALRAGPSAGTELSARLEAANAELQAAREHSQALAEEVSQLQTRLADAEQGQARLAEEAARLQAQLEEAKANPRPQTQEELEAYRRAERTERLANERVKALYAQVNGALGEATATVEQVCSQLGGLSQQVIDQLAQLQQNIAQGRDALDKASGALYAVKPLSQEE